MDDSGQSLDLCESWAHLVDRVDPLSKVASGYDEMSVTIGVSSLG